MDRTVTSWLFSLLAVFSCVECQLLGRPYMWSGSEHAVTPYFAYQHHVYQSPLYHPVPPEGTDHGSQEARHRWPDEDAQTVAPSAVPPPPEPEPEDQPTPLPAEVTHEPAKLSGPIINYSSGISPDGTYSYKYETADGISREETGIMKSVDGVEGAVREVRGSYSYPSPDGRIIRVSYVADHSGFRALGDHVQAQPPHNNYRFGRQNHQWNIN